MSPNFVHFYKDGGNEDESAHGTTLYWCSVNFDPWPISNSGSKQETYHGSEIKWAAIWVCLIMVYTPKWSLLRKNTLISGIFWGTLFQTKPFRCAASLNPFFLVGKKWNSQLMGFENPHWLVNFREIINQPSFIKYKLYPNIFGWFFSMSKIVKWLNQLDYIYIYPSGCMGFAPSWNILICPYYPFIWNGKKSCLKPPTGHIVAWIFQDVIKTIPRCEPWCWNMNP